MLVRPLSSRPRAPGLHTGGCGAAANSFRFFLQKKISLWVCDASFYGSISEIDPLPRIGRFLDPFFMAAQMGMTFMCRGELKAAKSPVPLKHKARIPVWFYTLPGKTRHDQSCKQLCHVQLSDHCDQLVLASGTGAANGAAKKNHCAVHACVTLLSL